MQFVVFLQILWALGAIFWNLSGIDMVDEGGIPPVPAPSWISIIILFALGILIMVFNNRRIRLVYKMACIGAVAYTCFELYQSFSTAPELWSDDAWQWSGVFINIAGLIAGMAGLFGKTRRQEYRPDPISPYFSEGFPDKK